MELFEQTRYTYNTDARDQENTYISTQRKVHDWSSVYRSEVTNCMEVDYAYRADRFVAHAVYGLRHYHNYLRQREIPDKSFTRNFLEHGANLQLQYVLPCQMRLELTPKFVVRVRGVAASNPYVNRDTPGRIAYGNPHLKGERVVNISANASKSLGRMYLSASVTNGYSGNLITSYTFLQDNIVHETTMNGARYYSVWGDVSLSGKVTQSTYIQAGANCKYAKYRVTDSLSKGTCYGFNARVTQDLPWNIYLEARGSYSSGDVFASGKSSRWYSYGLDLSRSFFKNQLNISLGASNFAPIHWNTTCENFRRWLPLPRQDTQPSRCLLPQHLHRHRPSQRTREASAARNTAPTT